jgi:DNA-binding transcriptional regulator YhcF (GntR family)
VILPSDTSKPIYVQIASWLENEILAGNLLPHERIYSQYQLADMFNINPATAAKGLTMLLEEGLVYKKRGLGMFIAEHAPDHIRKKRREQTLQQLIRELVTEANNLGVEERELLDMIKLAIAKRKDESP